MTLLEYTAKPYAEPSVGPSFYGMAISAKKLKVPFVRSPVFKPAAHTPYTVTRSNFLAWVNVVNLEASNIRRSAFVALPAKIIHHLNFCIPKLSLFGLSSKFILTGLRTVSCFSFLPTSYANPLRPSAFGVAFVRAKSDRRFLCSGFLNIKNRFTNLAFLILTHFRPVRGESGLSRVPRGAAIATETPLGAVFSLLSPNKFSVTFKAVFCSFRHSETYIVLLMFASYFQIACERVDEATRQGDMFVPKVKPAPIETRDIFEGDAA